MNGAALRIRLQPFGVTVSAHIGQDDENHVYLTRPEDFTKLGTAVLVDLYNAFNAGLAVKRFADRKTAEQRTWAVVRPSLQKHTNQTLPEEIPSMATATATAGKKTRRATDKTPKAATAPRVRGFDPEGVITRIQEDDGRREDSPGRKSFNLMKDGTTVAEFLKKGGRLKDLHWDVAKKHVKVGKATN